MQTCTLLVTSKSSRTAGGESSSHTYSFNWNFSRTGHSQIKSQDTNSWENPSDFMVQIQKLVRRLTHDILDYLRLLLEGSDSNLVNSPENAVLMESELFSILD